MDYPPPSSQQPQQPQYPQYQQQPQYNTQYPQPPMYTPPPMQQAPPPKKSRVLWIAIGVLIACVVACGVIGSLAAHSDSNTGTLVATAPTMTTAAPTQAPPAPAKHFKVGDVVSIGSTWQITVNSAKVSAGDAVSQPTKSGDQFLVIDVSMKNISAKAQTTSSLLQWKLQDSTGLSYTEAATDLGVPPDGAVQAGAPLRGIFVYEVPTTEKQFTLSFQADPVSSDATIWDISA